MMSHRVLSRNHTAKFGDVSPACKALTALNPFSVTGVCMYVRFKSHGKEPIILH